ncbi:hypothetical protein ANCDUO_12514 [Ancylostoma duodenale]|uniref:Symplekin/Pta1 N-terminal domain-containing protein n=1 Tax=Ancylostoma duodenale TaxID=51022 RepID=A0A0C2CL81_9BILA|nr:hypothetical protein ANCDUO_12514 [Ancylostoma duodenale]
MEAAEILVEPLGGNDSLADKIGELIREAQSTSDIKQKLEHLNKAQHLLLSVDSSGHLLDNFLDEMLEFTSSEDFHMRCFSANFIEKACKKDADILKKAITNLSYLLMSGSQSRGGVMVMKRVITVCANIYPYILKWACSRKADAEAEKCWEAFSVLKGRIVSHADSDNEG